MKLDPNHTTAAVNRIRRALGQLDGVVRMLESQRSCDDVIVQLAAVSRAVDKAGMALIEVGLEERLAAGGSLGDADIAQLERLFVLLA
jgi:DNA-binding FrmR family transcriptional regulator